MHATDLFHLFVTVLFTTQALILAVALWQVPLYLWHCWRQKKNQRQADEALASLATLDAFEVDLIEVKPLDPFRPTVGWADERAYTEGI